MPNSQANMVADFIIHFSRAIKQEMAAMRERMGSFEVDLAEGRRIDAEGEREGARYTYRLISTDEKLVPGMECSLRLPGGETLVRVEGLDGTLVTLWSASELDLGLHSATLVIYPWFLYEKLLSVLGTIHEDDFSVDRALTLFGKLKAMSVPRKLLRKHEALNDSQRSAVQLCLDANLAFIWGPPGTGKTTTLAHIVDELMGNGLRLLVLSTTNAAVDQALEKIVREPAMAAQLEKGKVVRIGRSEASTFGAALRDVVSRLHAAHQEDLDRYLARRPEVQAARGKCLKALEGLVGADDPLQQSLFGGADETRAPVDLDGIFTILMRATMGGLPSRELAGLIRRREARLERLHKILDARIAETKKALRGKELGVVERAGLVLSTLTNAYFSPLLSKQRFDVVIVEEASMAVLPALFYAACLGRDKTVMVGDPCQLPSIVQSDAPYVYKVMGRNIFEVTVPEPLSSPFVALLDVQYRMHPVIGALVSDSFYGGKLKHAADMGECSAIAGLEPYAGAPLVVLDTAGQSVCRQSPKGQSRLNDKTAEACVDLALRAVSSGAQSVAIITPYADQARAIRALLKEQAEGDERIECSTVHRFQGRERDVVILDTVDAEPMRPGVLLSERGPHTSAQKLINVAISRARGKLVIVADVEYFKQKAAGGVMSQVIARALAAGRRELLPPS